MIVGDGIMLGAGGETASIVVTAPTGSTVTCTTPNGIVLTAVEVSGTWTFARLKTYGTYTVTATNGSKSQSKNVLVDAAEKFDIVIDFRVYLFRDGDTCSSLTGGWVGTSVNDNYPYNWQYDTKESATVFTKTIDTKLNLEINMTGTAAILASMHTANAIQFSGYTKLCCSGNESGVFRLVISPSIADSFLDYDAGNATASQACTNNSYLPISAEINVTNIASGYIFVCIGGYGTDMNYKASIDKVWLE